jgi:hypothetical protein
MVIGSNKEVITYEKVTLTNIEDITLKNQDFRRVLYLYKGKKHPAHSDEPSAQRGDRRGDSHSVHPGGSSEMGCDSRWGEASDSGGIAVVIPAGTKHNIVNNSAGAVK